LTPQDRSLVIIAPERAAFREVEEIIGESNYEVHLDRRRSDRRRTGSRTRAFDERRHQGDRRAFDISEQLATAGWALIPVAQRG